MTTSDMKTSKRALHAILMSGFLSALGIGLLSFTLPLVSLDARVSGTWLGTGFAGFFLARLLAGPLGGMWADRRKPRMPLLWACGLGALAPMGYIYYPELPVLYGIQLFLGIVSGLIRPVGMAVIGGNVESVKLTRWFSFHTLMFNLAMVLGPVLGGLLYTAGDMQPVLAAMAACMAAAHSLVFGLVPSSIRSRRQHIVPPQAGKSGKTQFVPLLVAIFGRTFGIGVTVALYPVLLTLQLGHDAFLVALLFAIPPFMTCAGLPLGHAMQKRGYGNAALIGLVVSGVGLAFAGLGTQTWQFALAGFVMGLGSALSIPQTMAMVSSASSRQGAVFGASHVVTGLGFVLGPLAGGFILQSFNELSLVFLGAGVLGVICIVPWAWMVSKREAVLVFAVALFLVGITFIMHQKTEERSDSFYRYTDVAMGTVVNLTLDADSKRSADDASRKAFDFIRNMQRDYDYRNPDGSVARINQAAGRHSVVPTKRVYELLQRAVAFSESTDGVFDPTIGALTTNPMYFALDETIAKKKKGLVNYRLVKFNDATKRVWLTKPGMALDLGGIAKGAIIDATVNLLRAQGIRAGIVEAGGDFYCFGERDWTIGIRHPREKRVYASLTVQEKGVCGSGDYQQFVQVDSGYETDMRHHIIDPSSMEPADESIGVTVIADSAEMADVMATALFIMGPKKGQAFVQAKHPNVEAMWFGPDMAVITTTDFPKQ